MGRSVDIPVALTGEDKEYTVSATLQDADPAAEPGVLDILVHGGSYDRGYWDWRGPLAGRHSMLRAAARAGRSALVIDRLGAGKSSLVPSTQLTVDTSADALHQVIEWARLAGYERCNLIGHSLGSMIAVVTAAWWPDEVAALVLSGVLHGPLTTFQAVGSNTVQASADPLFAGRRYDSGYVTVSPENYESMLYYRAAPAIVAWDRTHRDVFSLTEFGTAAELWLAPPDSNPSARVTAPVHVIVGDHDAFFTGYPGAPSLSDAAGLHMFEQAYFPRAQSLAVTVVQDMGHCLNLHPDGSRVIDLMHGWLTSVGRSRQSRSHAAAGLEPR